MRLLGALIGHVVLQNWMDTIDNRRRDHAPNRPVAPASNGTASVSSGYEHTYESSDG